jgi:hypothetical protein
MICTLLVFSLNHYLRVTFDDIYCCCHNYVPNFIVQNMKLLCDKSMTSLLYSQKCFDYSWQVRLGALLINHFKMFPAYCCQMSKRWFSLFQVYFHLFLNNNDNKNNNIKSCQCIHNVTSYFLFTQVKSLSLAKVILRQNIHINIVPLYKLPYTCTCISDGFG